MEGKGASLKGVRAKKGGAQKRAYTSRQQHDKMGTDDRVTENRVTSVLVGRDGVPTRDSQVGERRRCASLLPS